MLQYINVKKKCDLQQSMGDWLVGYVMTIITDVVGVMTFRCVHLHGNGLIDCM